MGVINQHIVDEIPKENIRFVDYVIGIFPTLRTKNAVKKAIKKKLLLINGELASTGYLIKKGLKIELVEEKSTKKIYELELEVIYEDKHLAVINKPPGITVSGNTFKTIQNALFYNLEISSEVDALQVLLPVHRLDNQTSGLLIVAKTHSARIDLGRQFEEKTIKKTYTALVIGKPKYIGEIDILIEDKAAFTKYKTIKTIKSQRFNYLSMLELAPLTGRTHQLRIHCFKSGFPILGDKLYFNENFLLKGKGLFLCANYISFVHPFSKKEVDFKIDIPKKFKKYMLTDE